MSSALKKYYYNPLSNPILISDEQTELLPSQENMSF
jgi:hypothetical protein